jgi:hypothetical protein
MHEMKTLSRVLFDLAMHGADRGALVRPQQESKTPAVCVIMEGKTSLAELGGKLLEVAKSLGNGPADFGSPQINEEIRISSLFEIADKAPNGWCWAAFKFGRMVLLVPSILKRPHLDGRLSIIHESFPTSEIERSRAARVSYDAPARSGDLRESPGAAKQTRGRRLGSAVDQRAQADAL